LKQAFDAMVSGIETVVTYLFDKVIEPVFTAIATFIENHGDEIRSIIQDAWDAIKVIVETTMKVINDIITTIMLLIQGDWSGAWDEIKQLLQDVWDGMKQLVSLALDAMKQLLSITWDLIKIAAEAAWNGIKDLLNGIWNAISDNVSNIFTNIKDFLGRTWDEIKQKTTDVWNAIKQWFIDTATSVFNAATQPFIDAKNLLSTLWDNIKQKATDTWDAVKQWFIDSAIAVKNAVTQPFIDAKNSLDTMWDDAKRKATDTWDAIKQWFVDGKQAVINALEAPFNAFRDNIGGILDSAWTNAKRPLNSLINGYEHIVNTAADALNWIFDKLGLGNPFGHVNFPQLAQGTDYASGGIYQIAERGGELVYIPGAGWSYVKNPTEMFLPPGSKVIPASRSQNALSKSGVQSDLVTTKGSASSSSVFGYGRGGILDDITGAIGDIASSVVDIVKDWVSKGAEWVINKAIEAIGFDIELPGVFSQTVGAFLTLIKDKMKGFVSDLLSAMDKKVSDQEQSQANVGGATGGNYTGNNAVVKEAFRHLGEVYSNNYDGNGNHAWSGWCEAFVEAVGQHVGYARGYYGSARAHANAIHLNTTNPPEGASVFWNLSSDGHVTIAVGDGSQIGTTGMGGNTTPIAIQYPTDFMGWAPPGVQNGGFFRKGNPTLAWIGEGSDDEIAAPVPMLEKIVRDTVRQELINGGINVNFNSPVTIMAQDKIQAERSAQDFGFAAKQALRARGFR
jgi:phage-related protein